MEIKELNDERCAAWDAFVQTCPEASFFHKSGWKQVIEQAFGHKTHFIYAENNGRIEGVLPLGHVKSLLFGNSLVSVPFCVLGGVAATSDEARSALTQKAVEMAESLQVDYLELRTREPVNEGWPTKTDMYVNFRKEIDPDVETNLTNIPRKQRAVVRKGIKAGLESCWDEGVERLFDAYSQSVHALGTPVFSRRYFEVLRQVFKDETSVLTITKEGRLVASVLSFYFRDEVLPYYGGGTPEARGVKGNDFMYWELMRRSCEQGIKTFDYGRSKIGTGSYSFKKNWGFEPEPLNYQYHLVKAQQIPEINPLNPKYSLFIKAWKKMPLSMTRLIGPHIVKNLG